MEMKQPVVFLHGSADSARIWRLQTEYFTGDVKGTVFAIDLPGHGKRADTFPSEASIQDYARVVQSIIKQELDVEQPVIAGHSLGGAIALMMALEYGMEVSGLVLMGTGARLRVLPTLLEGAKNNPQETRRQLVEMAIAPIHRAEVVPAVIEEQQTPGPLILYRDLMACNNFDVINRLQEIAVPTLIICGEEDRLTPVKYSEYLHQQVVHSTLAIVPQAGHYVMREQPEKVNTIIERWRGA
jgi:pimeloyl-ACP methyl ester carboxylesterase